MNIREYKKCKGKVKEKDNNLWQKNAEDVLGPPFKKAWDAMDNTVYNVQFKSISEYGPREFTFAFFTLVAAGALTFTAAAIPGVGAIYQIFRAKNKKERNRIYEAIRRYKRRGLIEFKNGRIMVKADGKRLLSTYQARNLFFKKPMTWDGRWHIVIFDIPGKYENERKIFREQLKQFGFREYQKSVFITPYHCKKLINKLIKYLAIKSYVQYIDVKNMDNEEKLKRLFKL